MESYTRYYGWNKAIWVLQTPWKIHQTLCMLPGNMEPIGTVDTRKPFRIHCLWLSLKLTLTQTQTETHTLTLMLTLTLSLTTVSTVHVVVQSVRCMVHSFIIAHGVHCAWYCEYCLLYDSLVSALSMDTCGIHCICCIVAIVSGVLFHGVCSTHIARSYP